MSHPRVSIELPADYWAHMVVHTEIRDVVQLFIEKQLRKQGYGHLVDQKQKEPAASMPGATEKIESAINQVFGRLKTGH